MFGGFAAVAGKLAPDQVVGLDAVGAFVDFRDLGVAHELGRAGFLDVAHAAMHLHAQRCRFGADFGAPAFDHRHEKIDDPLRLPAHGGIGMTLAHVELAGREVGERAARFRERPHGQQHAPHVGMTNDGDRFRIVAGNVAALHAFAGEGRCLLQRAFGDGNTLEAHGQPRIVHRRKHVRKALVLLADEQTKSAAIVAIRQHRRRARMNAHLLFERHAAQVVALPNRAVLIDAIFGHDEQGDAFDAGGRVRQARQHQVYNVFGELVVPIGDENLLPNDAVVFAVANGARADGSEIGAGLRLARNHFRQEALFERGRAVMADRFNRGLRQHRAEREGHAGAVPHFLQRHGHKPWQALAAIIMLERHRVPAGGDESAISVGPAVGRAHHAVFEPRALFIADAIQGREDARGKLAAFLEDVREQALAQLLAAGQTGDLGKTCQPGRGEAHVGDGCGVTGHCLSSQSKPHPSTGSG